MWLLSQLCSIASQSSCSVIVLSLYSPLKLFSTQAQQSRMHRTV